ALAQPLQLPLGVIAILNGKRLQSARLAPGERLVESAHLASHHANGPAVGDDLVRRDENDCAARRVAQQRDANEGAAAQIERRPRLDETDPIPFLRPRCLRKRAQVDLDELASALRGNALHGPAIDLEKPCSQDLVPRDDLTPGALEQLT